MLILYDLMPEELYSYSLEFESSTPAAKGVVTQFSFMFIDSNQAFGIPIALADIPSKISFIWLLLV